MNGMLFNGTLNNRKTFWWFDDTSNKETLLLHKKPGASPRTFKYFLQRKLTSLKTTSRKKILPAYGQISAI